MLNRSIRCSSRLDDTTIQGLQVEGRRGKKQTINKKLGHGSILGGSLKLGDGKPLI